MLKIVVDATPISPKPSGVGLYVSNLIQSLLPLQELGNFELGVAYQPGMKKWLLGDWSFPKLVKKPSALHFLPIPVRISNLLIESNFQPGLSYFEGYLGSPIILHGTNYTVYPCSKSLKVMSLYDLTFIKYPNYINSVVKTYTKRVKQCLQWTDLVITISESSKRDIVQYLNVEPEKIRVTSLASRYSQDYLSTELPLLLEQCDRSNLSEPYILFVSTLEPRKNIETLISAFNFLNQKYKIQHQLVLIGQKGWHYQPILSKIEASPWRSRIHHLEYLSDEAVALFYARASVFVYPSYYEGFGLPILEAMTLGAPVVTSNTSSMPEVAGDAALLVNPEDPIELAEAILKVISDSDLRDELVRRGRERAKLYSWERTAKETLNAYRSIL